MCNTVRSIKSQKENNIAFDTRSEIILTKNMPKESQDLHVNEVSS